MGRVAAAVLAVFMTTYSAAAPWRVHHHPE
jgi:hypothetical protein